MSFNVSGLSDFTKKATKFLTEGVLFNDSYANYDAQTGIKYKEYLNFLDASPVLQAGQCSMTASGGTVFTQKEIQVCPMGVLDSWCLSDLDHKDIPGEVGTGKGKMTTDLKSALVMDHVRKIKQNIDELMWAGSVASGDVCNGLLTGMSYDSDVTKITGTSVTVTNIDDIVQSMILAVNDAMWSRGMLTIHMPLNYYNLYKQNRITSNMYWDDPRNKALLEMDVFGWEGMVKIKAEPGMKNQTKMVLTWDRNIVIGYDEVNEVAQAKMFYEEKTDLIYFKANWKIGFAYKYGSEIVLFSL